MMASAAPKPAAAEKPSVKGLASGLSKMVCICKPPSPRHMPTSAPMSAGGMRTCQRMLALLCSLRISGVTPGSRSRTASSPPGPVCRAWKMSVSAMPEGPVARSSSSSAASSSAASASKAARRPSRRP